MTYEIVGPSTIEIPYNADGTPVKLPLTFDYQFMADGKEITAQVYWQLAYARTGKAGVTLTEDSQRQGLAHLKVASLSTDTATVTIDAKVHLGQFIQHTVKLVKTKASVTPTPAPTPAPTPTPTPTPSPAPSPAPTPTPTPAPSPTPSASAYTLSILDPVTKKAPKMVDFEGIQSQVDTLQTSYAGYDYPCMMTPDRKAIRFETRPVEPGSSKRRAELHWPAKRVPNDVVLWLAYSFISEPWSAKMSSGGCEFQQHWDGSGSPGLAIRRGQDGSWQITTRGDGETNTKRYTGTCSFGEPHDVVVRAIFGPNGVLDVWLDGKQIITDLHVPMGGAAMPNGGTYPCIGAYYAGGVKCPVAVQYANVVLPSTVSLESRITARPEWPR